MRCFSFFPTGSRESSLRNYLWEKNAEDSDFGDIIGVELAKKKRDGGTSPSRLKPAPVRRDYVRRVVQSFCFCRALPIARQEEDSMSTVCYLLGIVYYTVALSVLLTTSIVGGGTNRVNQVNS